MRICIAIPYDLVEEGGVKRHAIQLAAALRRLGDEVDVIGPCSDASRDLGEHVHGFPGVVNIRGNGSDNRLAIFARPWHVVRLFTKRAYDVLHVHEPLLPTLNYYALWNAGAAARVATFHACIEDESAVGVAARKFFGAMVFPSFDRAIAVSPAAAATARVAYAGELAIIPNGIHSALYEPTPPPASTGAVRLLFVGHWRDPRKGLPHLLAACALLRERGIAFELDVVGDGGAQPRSELSGVRYHGAISSERRVAELHAAADVFISPATGAESFGIVLLEAMAAARPIVCSDLDGYRFAVGSGPDSGARLVPPGDPIALADALASLAGSAATRARMGELNRQRVQRFDWQRLVLDVRAVYEAAVAARGLPVTTVTS